MIQHISRFLLCIIIIPSLSFAASTCKTVRHQFFEKKDVKVWSTTICPGTRLAFHTHKTARILIPKENGTLEVLYKNGKKEFVKLVKDTPSYLPISEGIKLHQDINVGRRPLHLIVISLKNSKR